jgi:methionyl-tRNA formyltransferase
MNKIKILLMGTSAFAVPAFSKILDDSDFEIVGVFTQPDRRSGRGQEIQVSSVKDLVTKERSEVNIYQPQTLRTEESLSLVRSLNPDLIFIVSYGHILPQNILDIPRLGCVNLHASLLPKFRGASPINSAILSGLELTGITFFKLGLGIDDGAIIWQEKVPLTLDETYLDLHNHLAFLGSNVVSKVLKSYFLGQLNLITQNHKDASKCGIIRKDDGEIKWSFLDAEYIERMVRAYTPWPSAYTFFNGKRLKILSAEVSNERPHSLPGTVFITKDNSVAVRAKNKSLIVKNLQIEGKSPVLCTEFIKGYNDFIGCCLGDK